MSGENLEPKIDLPDANANEANEQEETAVLLFRGVDIESSGDRAGKWWSTNPYYSLRRSDTGKGSLFVAKVSPADLVKAKDVSLEAEYQNYFFEEEDPPGTREVTEEEMKKLLENTTFTKGALGGQMMATPQNAVEIGRRIFLKENESD